MPSGGKTTEEEKERKTGYFVVAINPCRLLHTAKNYRLKFHIIQSLVFSEQIFSLSDNSFLLFYR